MPPKRKAIETTPDPSPTPKRRATRSGALTEVQALTSGGSSTGLNGGYWDTPSKRQPRISTAEDKEGSLKENDADTDGDTNEPSDDEDPLLLSPSKSQASPSKRQPVRKYGRPTRKEIEQSASVPRGRAKVVPRGWQSRQPSVNTSTSRHLSPATVPPSTLASEDEDDVLPVIAPTPRRVLSAKSRSPTKRTRATSPIARTASSTTAQRARRRASPPLTDAEDTEDGIPSPPSSPAVQAKVLPLARASSSKKSGGSKKLTPPVEPLPPLTPFSLPKKQPATAEELGGDALPTIAKTPAASPRKQTATSPVRLPRALPMRFQPCLAAQKNAVLRALRTPPALLHENASEEEEPVTNAIAYDQLKSLLSATMERGEGNSCMLVGPRGSGKTHMVEHVLSTLSQANDSAGPIVIRLSGHVQQNDRLAMREIARQLLQQTGASFLDPSADESDEDEDRAIEDAEENPFLDGAKPDGSAAAVSVRLPPTAHLPSLISTLPTLGRPVIVLLDAFDLFAMHARQALLYCLLDTVQHSQAAASGAHYQSAQSASPLKGKGKAVKADDAEMAGPALVTSWSGLAVVGVTTRVDTLELLEKRVKSRFSGRILRTSAPGQWNTWSKVIRGILSSSLPDYDFVEGDLSVQWTDMWATAIDKFLQDSAVINVFRESLALVKDMRLVSCILAALVIDLTTEQPWPSIAGLNKAVTAQRYPAMFADLHRLHYPAICLLIAATHARTAGHDQVTFEQLHDDFRDQVRKSTAAPVQIEGGSIGMVRCSRGVLMKAFEQLVSARIFVPTGPTATAGLGREFVKHRCVPNREEVKRAVEKIGQTNLKKWFSKAS